MFDMRCLGCPAVPDPDETTCLFCLTDLDEEAFEKAFEQYEKRQEAISLFLAGY